MLVTDDYVFFWKGIFSQWWPSKIVDVNGMEYTHAEQYMMYQKAILFKDFETAHQIMVATTPREYQKLGRQVHNFDQSIWDKSCRTIVFIGNYLKYTQDSDCMKALNETRDRLLVEASPYDRIWGIGYAETEAEANIPNWGKNYLGHAITDVREWIRNKGTEIPVGIDPIKCLKDGGIIK